MQVSYVEVMERLRENGGLPTDAKGSNKANKFELPAELGKGSVLTFTPQQGVFCIYGDYQLCESCEFLSAGSLPPKARGNFVEIEYLLSGEMVRRVPTTGNREIQYHAGQFGIWTEENGASHTLSMRGLENIRYFFIRISNAAFEELLGSDSSATGEAREALTFTGVPSPISLQPNLIVAIHQFVNPPFVGISQNLYYKAKIFEILSYSIAIAKTNGVTALLGLSEGDRRKVVRVRDYLNENLESQPTLKELARLFATNEQKLKIGFRELFETTVFGYLQSVRLERAKQLLLEDTMSVSEVALTVGLSHFGRFATNFRERYGVSPSEYRRSNRTRIRSATGPASPG